MKVLPCIYIQKEIISYEGNKIYNDYCHIFSQHCKECRVVDWLAYGVLAVCLSIACLWVCGGRCVSRGSWIMADDFAGIVACMADHKSFLVYRQYLRSVGADGANQHWNILSWNIGNQ